MKRPPLSIRIFIVLMIFICLASFQTCVALVDQDKYWAVIYLLLPPAILFCMHMLAKIGGK